MTQRFTDRAPLRDVVRGVADEPLRDAHVLRARLFASEQRTSADPQPRIADARRPTVVWLGLRPGWRGVALGALALAAVTTWWISPLRPRPTASVAPTQPVTQVFVPLGAWPKRVGPMRIEHAYLPRVQLAALGLPASLASPEILVRVAILYDAKGAPVALAPAGD